MLMTYEQTLYTPYMLRSDPGVRNGDIFPYWPQNATRIELYGDQGVMYVGRMGGGWQVFVRTQNRQPVVKDQMHGRYSATRTTRKTSSARSRAASGPMPTSKKGTAACCWSTTPISAAGWAGASC
jgi:hypothetical protein